MVNGASPGPAPAAQARAATRGSPGPAGGRGPREAAQESAQCGWRLYRTVGHRPFLRRATHRRRRCSVAATGQRRGDQGHHLVCLPRCPAPAHPPGRGDGQPVDRVRIEPRFRARVATKERPAMHHSCFCQAWSSKVIWNGRGAKPQLHHLASSKGARFPGLVFCAKTIIPIHRSTFWDRLGHAATLISSVDWG